MAVYTLAIDALFSKHWFVVKRHLGFFSRKIENLALGLEFADTQNVKNFLIIWWCIRVILIRVNNQSIALIAENAAPFYRFTVVVQIHFSGYLLPVSLHELRKLREIFIDVHLILLVFRRLLFLEVFNFHLQLVDFLGLG